MNIQKSKYSMLDVTDNSNPNAKEAKTDTIWNSMLRRGSEDSSRKESPNQMPLLLIFLLEVVRLYKMSIC
jgi:hypothetical protein